MKNTMKVKTEINLDDIAAQLASESDEVQAKFLSVFFKALDLACESEYKAHVQLCMIWDKLSERGKGRLNFIVDEED